MALLVVGVVLALVYLAQTSTVATAGYDVQNLQAEQKDWVLRNDQLELELAKYQSLRWVESEAIGRLRMQRPEGVTFIDPGRVEDRPGSR